MAKTRNPIEVARRLRAKNKKLKAKVRQSRLDEESLNAYRAEALRKSEENQTLTSTVDDLRQRINKLGEETTEIILDRSRLATQVLELTTDLKATIAEKVQLERQANERNIALAGVKEMWKVASTKADTLETVYKEIVDRVVRK